MNMLQKKEIFQKSFLTYHLIGLSYGVTFLGGDRTTHFEGFKDLENVGLLCIQGLIGRHKRHAVGLYNEDEWLEKVDMYVPYLAEKCE